MADTIQTVLGCVNAREIGRTLTHEHMYIDYRNFYVAPPPELKEFLESDIELKNIGFVQRYPYSNKSNISFFSDDLKAAVLKDLKIFRKLKGSAIVENTTHGLNRNAEFLYQASKESGVHIIAGTGFYLASVQSNLVLNKSIEELCDVMIQDMTTGCSEYSSVKCGVIGEVASNYPIYPFELKSIQATGIVQEQLNCPVTFHPGRDARAPSEIMRLYTEAGGKAEKAVMSHLDRTLKNSELMDFAREFKCFLQQDLFGTEVLTYQLAPSFQMPSDYQRLERIECLISEGHLERILMSHDIHTKHRLAYYGGHGYSHVFCNIIPKMKDLGITPAKIDQITIENPRRWLSWNPKQHT